MKPSFNFDQVMKPFWQSDVMYNESVLMLSEHGKPAAARLLFKPVKILSVRNSYLDMEYAEGEDWIYRDGLLKLTDKSNAAYMTFQELYPEQSREGWTFPKTGGGNILSERYHFFHDKQLSVTYTHSGKEWAGPVFEFSGEKLPKTVKKLKETRKLKVALYGDSISAGYNSSGFIGVMPFQPHWGNLVVQKWRTVFKADIEFLNPSVGGKASNWGMENAEELVSKHIPDLTIIAFGMNDGTARLKPHNFKNNIKAIMENILEYNPDAEFILVAPMLPNRLAALPDSPQLSFLGEQENYKAVLDQLAGEGTVVADMTAVHRELLKHKRYCDMTGNNVNHPNDFLSRWYAQIVSYLLI